MQLHKLEFPGKIFTTGNAGKKVAKNGTKLLDMVQEKR
jgi:hypothetical protein